MVGCKLDASHTLPYTRQPKRGQDLTKTRGRTRRYAKGEVAGKFYSGHDPRQRRKMAREKSQRRLRERHEAYLCTRCRHRPPAQDRGACERCRETRQAAERERYTAWRTVGLCTRWGATFGGDARCGPCAVLEASRRSPERNNPVTRRLYARRRTRGECPDCGAPSQGAARCEPCARRSYERSTYFRGMPLYPPQYTIVELYTGDDHGTWNSWEDVAMCLAFLRLSLDQVEVLTDQSPVATSAAWE